MMTLTILVTPVNAVGHVNACSGALKATLRRGHRVIFVIEEACKGKLTAQGYEEYVYQEEKSTNQTNPGETLAKLLVDNKVLGNSSVWETMENLSKMCHGEQSYSEVAVLNEAIKKAIEKFKPNLIYYDGLFLYPVIQQSGIPWVKNYSNNPIYFIYEGDMIVPGGSGFPSDGDKNEFQEFNKIRKEYLFSKKYNDFIQQLGYERYVNDHICPDTQSLTVYAYPDEINYPYIKEKNWFNLEVFNMNEKELVGLEKLIPAEFVSNTLDGKFSGKLIYVSMGSMGSIDLELMKRLVRVLAKTNHKFIVSKGPRHAEYHLASNMYGDRFLAQADIIPHVDLVITHGGNNTVTETFAQGKPMIVLPLFADQPDNAQRLQETGFGIRLQPYNFTESELVQAVDTLLYDESLKQKLHKASKRIQQSKRHEELVNKLEQLSA